MSDNRRNTDCGCGCTGVVGRHPIPPMARAGGGRLGWVGVCAKPLWVGFWKYSNLAALGTHIYRIRVPYLHELQIRAV